MGEREIESERESEGERERARKSESERECERESEREIERESEREGERGRESERMWYRPLTFDSRRFSSSSFSSSCRNISIFKEKLPEIRVV